MGKKQYRGVSKKYPSGKLIPQKIRRRIFLEKKKQKR